MAKNENDLFSDKNEMNDAVQSDSAIPDSVVSDSIDDSEDFDIYEMFERSRDEYNAKYAPESTTTEGVYKPRQNPLSKSSPTAPPVVFNSHDNKQTSKRNISGYNTPTEPSTLVADDSADGIVRRIQTPTQETSTKAISTPTEAYTNYSFEETIRQSMPYFDEVKVSRETIDEQDVISVRATREATSEVFAYHFDSQTAKPVLLPVSSAKSDERFNQVVTDLYNERYYKPNIHEIEYVPSDIAHEVIQTGYDQTSNKSTDSASYEVPQRNAEDLQTFLREQNNSVIVHETAEGLKVSYIDAMGQQEAFVLEPQTYTIPNASSLTGEVRALYEGVGRYSKSVEAEVNAVQYLHKNASTTNVDAASAFSAEQVAMGENVVPTSVEAYTNYSFEDALRQSMPYFDEIKVTRETANEHDVISVKAIRKTTAEIIEYRFDSQTSAPIPLSDTTHTDDRFGQIVTDLYRQRYYKPNIHEAEYVPSSDAREIVRTDYKYTTDELTDSASYEIPQRNAEDLQAFLRQQNNTVVVYETTECLRVSYTDATGPQEAFVLEAQTYTTPNASSLTGEIRALYEGVGRYSESVKAEVKAIQYLHKNASMTNVDAASAFSAEQVAMGEEVESVSAEAYDFLVVRSSAGSAVGEFNPANYDSLRKVIVVDIEKLGKTNPSAANALLQTARVVPVSDDVKKELNDKNYTVYGLSQYRGTFTQQDYDASAFYSDTTIQYFADFPMENQLSITSDSFGIALASAGESMMFARLRDGSRKLIDKADPMVMPGRQLAKGLYQQGEFAQGSSQFSSYVLPIASVIAASGATATAVEYAKNAKTEIFLTGDLYDSLKDTLATAGISNKDSSRISHRGETSRSLNHRIRGLERSLGFEKGNLTSATDIAERRQNIADILSNSDIDITPEFENELNAYDASLVAREFIDNLDSLSNEEYEDVCRRNGLYKPDEEIKIENIDDVTKLRRRISEFSKRQGCVDLTRTSLKDLNAMITNPLVSDSIKEVVKLEIQARKVSEAYRYAKKLKFKRLMSMTRLIQKLDGGSDVSKGVMTGYRLFQTTKETIKLTKMMARAVSNQRQRHFAKINKVRLAAGKSAKIGVYGQINNAIQTSVNGLNTLTTAVGQKIATTAPAQYVSGIATAGKNVVVTQAKNVATGTKTAAVRASNVAKTASQRLMNTQLARNISYRASVIGNRLSPAAKIAAKGAAKTAAATTKTAAVTKSSFQALGKIFSTVSKGVNSITIGIVFGVLICMAVAWIVSVAGNTMIGIGTSMEPAVEYFETASMENIVEKTVKELDKLDTNWLKEAHEWSNNNVPNVEGYYNLTDNTTQIIDKYGCDDAYTDNDIHIAGYDLKIYERTADGNREVPLYRSNAKAIIACGDTYILSAYGDYKEYFKQYCYKCGGGTVVNINDVDISMSPALWYTTHSTDTTNSPIYTCDLCNCRNYTYYCNDSAQVADVQAAKATGNLKTNSAILDYAEKGCIQHTAPGGTTNTEKSYCGLLHRRLTFSGYEYYVCCPENESKGAGHDYVLSLLADCDNYSTLYRDVVTTSTTTNAYEYNPAPADTSCTGKSFTVKSYFSGWFVKKFDEDDKNELINDIEDACEDHPYYIIRVGTASSYSDYSLGGIAGYINSLDTDDGETYIYVLCKGHYNDCCSSSCTYTTGVSNVITSCGTITKLDCCTGHSIAQKISADEQVTHTETVPYYECNGHCNGHMLEYCTGHIDALISLYSRQDVTKMVPATDAAGFPISGKYINKGFESVPDGGVNPDSDNEYYTITGNDDFEGFGRLAIEGNGNGDLFWDTWKTKVFNEETGLMENKGNIRVDMAFAKWNTDWEEAYGIIIESEYDMEHIMSEDETNALISDLGGDVSTGVPKARYEFVSKIISNTVSNDLTGKLYKNYSDDRYVRYAFRQYTTSAYLRGLRPLNIDSEITNYDSITTVADTTSVLPGDVVVKNNVAMIVVGIDDGSNFTVVYKTVNAIVMEDISSSGCALYRLFKDG